MARAIWSGSISFGLVNVPVKLYSAVHQHDVSFHQFGPKGDRIKYKRVSEKTGKEIDYEDIQKGYELDDGRFVLIDPKELEAFQPRATRTIDIDDFVDLEDIDPIYYENTYYLAPASDDAGTVKAYSLLLEAMRKQKKVAIGKIVMRTKQYLAAIRPLDDVLALSTMLFADEVVPASEVADKPDGKHAASDREVKMAGQIIDSLSTDWDPTRYEDTYTEQVMEFIHRKAEGKDVVAPEREDEDGKVMDLMAALEASLAAAKGKDGKGGNDAQDAKKGKAGGNGGSAKRTGRKAKASSGSKSKGGSRRKSA